MLDPERLVSRPRLVQVFRYDIDRSTDRSIVAVKA
jgi:hypothetical protein